MVMTPSNFGALLYPSLREWFFEHYATHESSIKYIYKVEKSDRNSELLSGVGAVGDIPVMPQGGQMGAVEPVQTYPKTFTFQRNAGQIRIDPILVEDDQTGIIKMIVTGLASAARRTREKFAFEPFNNAFSGALQFAGPDNLPLVSAAHTTPAGGMLFDNRIPLVGGVPPPLTYAAIQSAYDTMLQLRNDQDDPMQAYADLVVCHPFKASIAMQSLNSFERPDTSSRAASTIYDNTNERILGAPPRKFKLLVSPYLSSTTAWFVCDSKLLMMFWRWYNRIPVDIRKAGEWNSFQALYGIQYRCGRGYADWRGVLGANATT